MAIYYPLAFEDDKNRKIESEENLWDNKNRLIINWDFLPWKINMYGRSIELIESTFWSQQIGCIRNLGPTCDTSFWHVDIRAGITVQAPLKLANSSFFMFLTILWTLILTIWGSCGDLNRLYVWGIQRTGLLIVVLYLHALDSNGNKRAECNFENNSWDRQGHFGGKISISLEMEPGFGLNNQTWEMYINVCCLLGDL